MSTVSQFAAIESDALLRRMIDKMRAFQSLLLEEQDATRSLSFGQFTSVTMRKTQLLDEVRELEQQRRNQFAPGDSQAKTPARVRLEAELVAAIGETDRLNRLNASLIGQSLEFLQGTLRLWQRSPESAALYSSSGNAIGASGGMVRVKG